MRKAVKTARLEVIVRSNMFSGCFSCDVTFSVFCRFISLRVITDTGHDGERLSELIQIFNLTIDFYNYSLNKVFRLKHFSDLYRRFQSGIIATCTFGNDHRSSNDNFINQDLVYSKLKTLVHSNAILL